MANPKTKTSRARRDMRRANLKLDAVTLNSCPQCHEPKLPHHVCGNCGYYKGNPVIEKAE
ncbi:MAG TPA: 50S ribosomal protein L32 [Firmicutes bacterium]|jgi:large subunit ribosomal protein L32|nr:50S ribosomal protein L32 [Bacillota bacterium]HOQ24066.1 50S ribosomal protein L32 [Bacillota bacterium]HPT67530.1 50S ribosomal protein L32 [Bacillota bacterium]